MRDRFHELDDGLSRREEVHPDDLRRDGAAYGPAEPGAAMSDQDLAARQGFATGPMTGQQRKIRQVERLADWLDTKFRIPIVNYPIGLDGIIGLIPGVGDTITTGLSGWLIYEAHRAGASKRTLARMGANVGIDWLVGLIPIVGDLVDIGYKANAKNARLLLDELRRNAPADPPDLERRRSLRDAA